MKAIILAGGVGSRLRPMTCDCPKPMAPVLDRPVMEYAVRLLKKHGVREIAATLCYLPGQIREYFGNGSRFDVEMRYYMENEPLGTAGGVKLAQEFLDETFFVLSGDGLTDCDLSAALRFHREKKAMATIVLKEAAAPTEYGVAVVQEDGRIRSFLEKPDWSDVLSDRVNTGIYILEPEALRLVPEGVQVDFSRDLFPKLMQSGAGVYGYVMEGYWCDIGDVESYLGANRAVLAGEADVDAGFAPGKGFVHEGAKVAPGALLEEPCWIGPGAVVEHGARIGSGSVVGAGARVGRGAVVKRSVLWPGAELEDRAQASGCVLCDGAVLEEGACAYECAVVGKNSALGRGGALAPGMRIWPGKRTEEFGRVQEDIVWGSGCGLKFRGGQMKLHSAQQALLLGEVLAQRAKGVIVTADDGENASRACKQAVIAGIGMAGEAIDMGSAALPVLREACRLLRAGAGVYCMGGRVFSLNENGARPECAELRKMEKALCAERMPEGFGPDCVAARRISGMEEVYLGGIEARFGAEEGVYRAPAAVFAPEEGLLQLTQKAFSRAGRICRAEFADGIGSLCGETGFFLGRDGTLERMGDASAAVQGDMLRMLLVWTALEAGEKLIPLSAGEPEAMRALCGGYSARIEEVHSGEGEEQAAMARVSSMLLRLHTDGIFAALSSLAALEARGMLLWDWQETLPRAAVLSQSVPVETARKGRVLRDLAERFPQAELGDGVRFRTEIGRVWVRPSSDSAQCLISCEAADMDSAQELIERCRRLICPQE
ncbi:MAG: NTP transferase domain-containing protein [Clostridia bacterium]|nr:NTP transferase domain-containing protein [Clostridia bacterium]